MMPLPPSLPLKKRTLFIIGLGIYAIALLITAPATLVNIPLKYFGQHSLQLTEAQGTLWSGRGRVDVSDANGQHALSEQVTWHWQPESLLRLRFVYYIQLDPGSPRPFLVTLSWSGIEVGSTELDLPARLLGQSSPRLAALGLTGDVHLQVRQLFITRRGIKGSASLQWRSAASALTPVAPLGDYELILEKAGPDVQATLRTLQGPLQLNGKGSWSDSADPSSHFLATAHIAPAFQQKLAPFLRLIGVERQDGSFELKLL